MKRSLARRMAEQGWPACENFGSIAAGARDTASGLFPAIPERACRAPALERHQSAVDERTRSYRSSGPTHGPCRRSDAPRFRTGATNEWQRALEVAKTPEKLLALAKYAEQNSANDTPMLRIPKLSKSPRKIAERTTGRLRLALAAGKTADAQTIAAEITQLWPDDAAARNQNAYLQLLLGASDGVAETAEHDAEVLVRTGPRNWPARATLGLARLRLGRNADALAAIRDIRVTGNEPPGAMAVRAAILAANGYEEGARNDAHTGERQPALARRTRANRSAAAIGVAPAKVERVVLNTLPDPRGSAA